MVLPQLLLAMLLAGQAPPTFEASIEMVSVDVSVFDATGAPVRGLTTDDFQVKIDGRPRRVVSAVFVDLAGGSQPPAPSAASPVFSNEGRRPGRLVILAVDQGQITSGQGRALIRSADRLLDQMTPSDRVGLIVFPAPAPPGVEPTADQARVRAALAGLSGRANRIGSGRLGTSEAIAYHGGEMNRWQAALERECPADLDPREHEMCQAEVEAEAMQMASELRRRSEGSLRSLQALFEGLAGIEGPKSVVLITEGLWTEHPGDIRQLAERASAAGVALYVLQLDSPLMPDASIARPSETAFEDQDLRAHPLASLAALARGTVFRTGGSAEIACERIARELSGHYVLGVEPEETDRDGRQHGIRVSVARQGVSIRARGRVAIARPGAGPTVEQQLAATLRSPFAQTGLSLRATPYALGGTKPDSLRLLLAVEVRQAQSAPLAYALQLLDEKGQAVGTAAQRLDELTSPAVPFQATVAAPPGRYTLRLAVVDGAGRRGSLEEPLDLRLEQAATYQASDLLVGRPPAPGAGLRPVVQLTADGAGFAAHLELYGSRFDGVEVAFEIAEPGSGSALLSLPARLQEGRGGLRVAQSIVVTDVLPPGDYVLRSVVTAAGRSYPLAGRPFQVAPRAAGTATGLSLDAVRPALRRFDRSLLLQPEVIAHFVGRMEILLPEPRSVQLEQAMARARAGSVEAALDLLAEVKQPDARVLFLRGVALLQKNALAQATASLRESARSSSVLLPAVVYLGACLAANGEDREAAGAWQTALLGESDSRVVYSLLTEALLRLDDLDGAAAIIEEALASWPEDPELQRSLGILAARRGDTAKALELLGSHAEHHPDDAGALLLTLRLLLQALSAAGGTETAAEQRDRALRYARAYLAAGGPERPVVESWLRFLEKPATPRP